MIIIRMNKEDDMCV